MHTKALVSKLRVDQIQCSSVDAQMQPAKTCRAGPRLLTFHAYDRGPQYGTSLAP